MEDLILRLGHAAVNARNDAFVNGLAVLFGLSFLGLCLLYGLGLCLAAWWGTKFRLRCNLCFGKLALATNYPPSLKRAHQVAIVCLSCRKRSWRDQKDDLKGLGWEPDQKR